MKPPTRITRTSLARKTGLCCPGDRVDGMQEVECLYYLLSEAPPTAASGGYLHNFPKLYPRPASLIATHALPCRHSRASPSPSPHSAKIKEQKGNERTEGRKQCGRPTPEPATPPSPQPPPVRARPPFPPPYPLCLAPGRSEVGRDRKSVV